MPMWPMNRSTRTAAPASATIMSSRSCASSNARWASAASSPAELVGDVAQRALEVCRELPALRPVAPRATRSRSTSSTRFRRSSGARKNAVATPAMPAPTTTTSARASAERPRWPVGGELGDPRRPVRKIRGVRGRGGGGRIPTPRVPSHRPIRKPYRQTPAGRRTWQGRNRDAARMTARAVRGNLFSALPRAWLSPRTAPSGRIGHHLQRGRPAKRRASP